MHHNKFKNFKILSFMSIKKKLNAKQKAKIIIKNNYNFKKQILKITKYYLYKYLIRRIFF